MHTIVIRFVTQLFGEGVLSDDPNVAVRVTKLGFIGEKIQ